jgi:hypothetical protein
LLLSRSCDAGLSAVQGLLTGAGIPVARIDADAVAGIGLTLDLDARRVSLGGRWLAPTVTWTRHFSPQAIEERGGAARAAFARDSWSEVPAQLAAISGLLVCPRRLGPIAQLTLATRHHVVVPRTIITTDPSSVADAFQCSRLVVKAARQHFVEAEPGRLSGIFPVIVERDELSATSCPGPPVIVQEYIEHEAELRVYYVAGRVLGFEVGKHSPADLWTDPAAVVVRSAVLPPQVVAATRILASAMSLRFGAFDFLLRAGTAVFLEANPDGDWLWAQRAAPATEVTQAVAVMLADLHRAAAPGRPRTGPAGPGQFELLAFLGAGQPG